jgi:hypothetical protein
MVVHDASLPLGWLNIIYTSLLATVIANALYLVFTEYMHQSLLLLHRWGFLTRFQAAVPQERDIWTSLISATSLEQPVAFYSSIVRPSVWPVMVFEVNAFEIISFQVNPILQFSISFALA